MLYEKTLSRKIVSISSKSRQSDKEPEIASNGDNSNGIMISTDHPWRKQVLEFFMRPFRPPIVRSKPVEEHEKLKQLATMGKIMNLMR